MGKNTLSALALSGSLLMNNGASAVNAVAHDTQEAVEMCLSQKAYYDLRKLAGWRMGMDPRIEQKYPDLVKLLRNQTTVKEKRGSICLDEKISNELLKVAGEMLQGHIYQIIQEYNRGIGIARKEGKPHEVERLIQGRQVVIDEFITKYPGTRELILEILKQIDKKDGIHPAQVQ